MSRNARCPECGAELRAEELDAGVCPKCVLRLALEATPGDATLPGADGLAEPLPTERIGPYRIVRKLGEGGMGVVFLAGQREPMQREVALKLIKLGMDTREVVARFESERQALALMNHPNVAKVLDGGATPAGRPYFVMEYVAGEPITDYCDQQRLSTRQRLELFIDVCRGVQHAHQKGLLHRDIKPSNVLVETQQDRPLPKIIDFGVAKATNQRLTERTVFTRMGQLIGTPEYMSPEQADLQDLDIDTRTDVYSLGVLLYELLAGALPFDSEQLRAAGFAEVCRRIREDIPSKPSTRVSSLGDATTAIAERRRTDLTSLTRGLRGDLDWITMKALEKQRTRRYETPAHLAADIERHLNHEPVVAGPPDVGYRARKFVRRHRVAVGVTAVVLLGLAAGMGGTTIGVIKARRAEAHAVRQADVKTRVADFLKDLFTVSAPSEARGNSITARELLDEAAKKIEDASIDEETRAELLETMGDVYRRLGLYDQAEPLLDKATKLLTDLHGHDHPARLGAVHTLARLYREQGRYVEAEPLIVDTLERRRRVLGLAHADTLDSAGNLGLIYFQQGRYEETEPIYLEILEGQKQLLGEEDGRTLSTMNNLAALYRRMSRYEDAERINLETLEKRRRVLGDDHPDTISSRNNLAVVYWSLGRMDKAEEAYLEVLATCKRVFGDDHLATLQVMNNLALVYQNQERWADAEPLFSGVLARRREVLGNDHRATIGVMDNLAVMYQYQGEYEKASALALEALETARRALGEEHPNTLRYMNNVGSLYQRLDRWAEAEALHRDALSVQRRTIGEDHSHTLHSKNNLAVVCWSTGRFDEAEPLFIEVLEARKRVIGDEHADTVQSRANLGFLYRDTERYDQARDLLREVFDIRKRTAGEDDAQTLSAAYDLGALEAKSGNPSGAFEWLWHAIDRGYDDADQIQHDALLASLRGPDLDALITAARRNASD